jgi:stalled ribosome rescue protein Dom34
MSTTHAAVWLDHAEAHVLHFTSEDVQNKLASGKPYQLLRHERGAPDLQRLEADLAYYRRISSSLAEANEILVTGPASATRAFVKYLNEKAHGLRARIIAIESVSHPSDSEMLEHARKHFRGGDAMGVT